MKAVILAAGRGTRLIPLTNTQPKCLLEIDGKAIIDYQIESVLDTGINEIIVVTGYLHELIKKHLGSKCHIIFNDKFSNTNSMYSLWLARHLLIGYNFVLLNGDVILSSELLKKIVKAKEKTAALIEIGRKAKTGEMNVIIENGVITEFSKSIKGDIASGESVQVTKFSVQDSFILFEEIEKIILGGNHKEFPAVAYKTLINKSGISPIYTEGLEWFEIDTIEDFEKKRNKG